MTVAAGVAFVLLVIIGVFQLALALGAPWGRAAWGGRIEGVLPARLRIASGIVAILVYPLIALLVVGSAQVVDVNWLTTGEVVMWVVTAFFMLGALANLASRSKLERIWSPVSLAIAVCSAIIALTIWPARGRHADH
jgi:hypothetical protein